MTHCAESGAGRNGFDWLRNSSRRGRVISASTSRKMANDLNRRTAAAGRPPQPVLFREASGQRVERGRLAAQPGFDRLRVAAVAETARRSARAKPLDSRGVITLGKASIMTAPDMEDRQPQERRRLQIICNVVADHGGFGRPPTHAAQDLGHVGGVRLSEVKGLVGGQEREG